MRGTPKHLNTKEDYYILRDMNIDQPEVWRPHWQALLDEQHDWFCVGTLPDKESGITDDTHKVVESEGMGGDTVTYSQYEWQRNPHCTLLRLGFTVEEVENVLAEKSDGN